MPSFIDLTPADVPVSTSGTTRLALGAGGAVASSVNGGAFTVIAGGTSVTSSAPVSGDGSVGNPLTVAANAVTNASLATMAAATVKGSVAGGTPSDFTAAHLTAL